MIWHIAEDIFYYEVCNNIKNDIDMDFDTPIEEKWYQYFKRFDEIVILPSKKKIRKKIGTHNTIFLSNNPPPIEFKNIFVMKELANLEGALTSQEVENSVTLSESLENKLGLKSSEPELTFKNLGGSFGFKKWADFVDLSRSRGNAIKPVFLLGVPGVGKSYLAACYAGEKGIPLMQLDLSIIKEKSDPATTIEKVFQYISKMEQEVVLLIDEIEQSITDTNSDLLGSLLTIFNDLNTSAGYSFKGILFATSNNITSLVNVSPQFIRHGRWNEKFFVNYPTKPEAIEVMLLYRDKYNLDISVFDETLVDLMYIIATEIYKDFNINEKTSVYSNSEISYLFERLSLYYTPGLTRLEIETLIKEQIKAVEPLQKTAHGAIQRLLNDAKNNKFTEV